MAGGYMELLVRTRNFRPSASSRAMNSGAPGTSRRPTTSTPSMSVSTLLPLMAPHGVPSALPVGVLLGLSCSCVAATRAPCLSLGAW